ncbi:MAG: hypothetical protein OXE17_01225 [Chloroflexi bacterium]|nr:hypothetical protein [Chloroflexota bacterium]
MPAPGPKYDSMVMRHAMETTGLPPETGHIYAHIASNFSCDGEWSHINQRQIAGDTGGTSRR